MCCNDCHYTFDISEAAVVYKNLYGISVPEKKCPICGGSFRALELPDELDKYLFCDRDKRYYVYE